jgi:hypothetical protein
LTRIPPSGLYRSGWTPNACRISAGPPAPMSMQRKDRGLATGFYRAGHVGSRRARRRCVRSVRGARRGARLPVRGSRRARRRCARSVRDARRGARLPVRGSRRARRRCVRSVRDARRGARLPVRGSRRARRRGVRSGRGAPPASGDSRRANVGSRLASDGHVRVPIPTPRLSAITCPLPRSVPRSVRI